MKETDIKHLEDVYRKLVARHENANLDYMVKLKTIIDELKLVKPMAKRWKIKLPETIKSYDIVEMACNNVNISWLFTNDGLELTGHESDRIIGIYLEEIEEIKPYKSPRCWLRDKYPKYTINDRYSHGALMNAFIDGREDNELKHCEAESFQEWDKKEGNVSPSQFAPAVRHERRKGWDACNKSRGYE